MSIENIPSELKQKSQFVVWKLIQKEGALKKTKPPFNVANGWPASVTDPKTWATFDDAVARLQHVNGVSYDGIGYVIAPDDPYTFIDLDSYDPTLTDDDRARHTRIADAFKGYAEISPSGKGLHLIVRGKVPTGRRRGGVEIYSGERYMTLTGNVWRAGPIVEQQALLTTLWEELGADQIIVDASKHETAQLDTDYNVCERAANAMNGSLFVSLYKGEWQQGYPSQSEADFAMIDILSFYTQNREQIKRIFRASALGKRDKAKRDNYLDSMIVRSFDNQPVPINFDALKANIDDELSRRVNERALLDKLPTPAPALSVKAEAASIESADVSASGVSESADEVYSVPPGLLGEIARYVYDSAPRPVKEVALTAAIGLMAGICGRAFNVSGTGLNQYLLLLAPTGSGKEAISSGISRLMEAVSQKVPSAMDFIGPEDIRSDIALTKHLSRRSPSFVTIGGEFGSTLAQMAGQSNNTNKQAIKRMMLLLYGRSGEGDTLKESIYSDADKGTPVVKSPAFSFIGESAPESFYESVDENLVADGLLPRFTLIEYKGHRPPLNKKPNFPPSEDLVKRLADVCVNSLHLNKNNNVAKVAFDSHALNLFNEFDEFCTAQINEGNREVIRHLWNRAHLRALKLAALIAVGVNPWAPVVAIEAAQWAIRLSSHNTRQLLVKFELGEVGNASTDSKHVSAVKKAVREFAFSKYEPKPQHAPSFAEMHKQGVIPYSVIQNKLYAYAAFANDRRGAKIALKISIETLCDAGVLQLIDKRQAFEKYAFSGVCYAIVSHEAL